MTANDRQVGGNHYRKAAQGGEQHWDRMWRLYREAWFVGSITKYIERYRDKDGIKDLEKAKHYLEKLIELEKAALEKEYPSSGAEDHSTPTNGLGAHPDPKNAVLGPDGWPGVSPTTHFSLPDHWGTLCGAQDGGAVLTDQPEQVTCPRCILFMTYNQEENNASK